MTSLIAKAAVGKEYAGDPTTLREFLAKLTHSECAFCALAQGVRRMSKGDRLQYQRHLIIHHGLHYASTLELT